MADPDPHSPGLLRQRLLRALRVGESVWRALLPHLTYAVVGVSLVSLLHGAFLIDIAADLNRNQEADLAAKTYYYSHEATPLPWFLVTVTPTAFFLVAWLGLIETSGQDKSDDRAQSDASINEENGSLPLGVFAGVIVFNFMLVVCAPFAIFILSQELYELFH